MTQRAQSSVCTRTWEWNVCVGQGYRYFLFHRHECLSASPCKTGSTAKAGLPFRMKPGMKRIRIIPLAPFEKGELADDLVSLAKTRVGSPGFRLGDRNDTEKRIKLLPKNMGLVLQRICGLFGQRCLLMVEG